ncbi:MAG: dockerin type I domain-containing protein [Phycisphaerae bacterium]
MKMGFGSQKLAVFFIGFVAIIGFTNFSQGVIIDSDNGTGNASPPTSPSTFPYWDSIGTAGGGSCVYLGSGYCLSAYHIKVLDFDTGHYSKTVNLGGVDYDIDDNTTWQRFKLGSNDADLMLFHLTTIPTPIVPVSNIITTMQKNNTKVWMMGYGYNRAAAKSYWDDNWTLTDPNNYTYSGYYWGAGHTKRWGTNVIDLKDHLVDDGYGITQTYGATFNSGVGDNESVVAIGDSGGPVFINPSSTWWLAGINITRGGYPGQPWNTSVYGKSSYFADMSAYPITAVGGTVTLQDFMGDVSSQKVTIEIRTPGLTTPLQTHLITLQSTGGYSLITCLPAPGPYDLAVKGSHWLRQKANVSIPISTADFTLINGDCNGDNSVTSDDLSFILSAMDSVSDGPGWDSTADMDGDLEITSTDLSIALLNMDIAGNP